MKLINADQKINARYWDIANEKYIDIKTTVGQFLVDSTDDNIDTYEVDNIRNIEVISTTEPKTCMNESNLFDGDEFICSECGIHLTDWVMIEKNDDCDEETRSEYMLCYCPNCGKKIMYESEQWGI